ncbi:MAG TPA: VOC family protein [Bryobacteraceae bacterium]|nr:VOC family protein [Bryobacteraceae bacterium]
MVLLIVLLAAAPALAQLPDFYKSVDRIVWVVDDLDRTVAAWKKTGMLVIADFGTMETEDTLRGQPIKARFRWAVGRFPNVTADFVQPLDGGSAYSEYLKKHGAGVFALIHRVPNAAALNAEVARMEKLGVGVLQRQGDAYVMLDTEPGGKYVLGLLNDEPPPAPAPLPSARPVTQYAFAVRDLDAVSKYWSALGWPVMSTNDFTGPDRMYRGNPGRFTMRLGWQRHGKVPYEWILSTRGPNVYEDHLAKHGEGFHHLAFNVEDMDEATKKWESWGFAASQSGAWGERGKPGSGRYAYHDLHTAAGIDVELLWNYREK